MKYQSNLYLRCTIRCSTVGSGRQFAAGDGRQLRLRPPTQKTGTHVRCIALISSATTAKSSARFAFMHWLVLHRWHSQKKMFRAASDNCSTWAASRLGSIRRPRLRTRMRRFSQFLQHFLKRNRQRLCGLHDFHNVAHHNTDDGTLDRAATPLLAAARHTKRRSSVKGVTLTLQQPVHFVPTACTLSLKPKPPFCNFPR